MENLMELVGKLSPLLILLIPLVFSRRKTALDNLALAVNTQKAAAEAEAVELANEDKKRKQLADMDDRLGKMRVLVGEQVTKYEDQQRTLRAQADEIQQLNAASVRHGNELAEANKSAADYKDKYERAVLDIQACRASCEQQAATIRVLEAFLSTLGYAPQAIEQANNASEPPAPPADTPTEAQA